jgi:hypothetical protein
MADAKLLWDAFTKKLTQEDVQQILSGKYSIKDIWMAKAHGGNDRLIQQIIQKLFPDQLKGDFIGDVKVSWQSKKS